MSQNSQFWCEFCVNLLSGDISSILGVFGEILTVICEPIEYNIVNKAEREHDWWIVNETKCLYSYDETLGGKKNARLIKSRSKWRGTN